MSKLIIPASIISVSIIAAVLVFSNKSTSNSTEQKTPDLGTSVVNEGDTQIVQITAKGGYSPTLVQASANKDTILRVKTVNTFDCSSALSIPSLGISRILPPTGTTDVRIGVQKSGTQISGTCSMGMYNFSIKFI